MTKIICTCNTFQNLSKKPKKKKQTQIFLILKLYKHTDKESDLSGNTKDITEWNNHIPSVSIQRE